MSNVTPQTKNVNLTLDLALEYLRRGWAPIPIPFRDKNPGRFGWQKERHTKDDWRQNCNNGQQINVGVLMGEPSGGLTDIDLDHPIALKLARFFLPVTGLTFGRRSKPESHWLYKCADPRRTEKYESVTRQANGKTETPMLVEIRGTGGQTVFPPSTHPSGEAVVCKCDDFLDHYLD